MIIDRPHVILSIAMTDTVARRGAPISSPSDLERVDRLRAASDDVVVGRKGLRGTTRASP